MVMASATCCWYWPRSRLMKAVMARILGRAGSGGALRWAWAALNTRRSETAQRRAENRTLPRRMGCLQLGRSNATPLQDTGIGASDFEKSMVSSRLNKGGDAGDALADYELVDVVGAFVGGDAFEIVHVAHDGVVVDDAVGAENVAGFASGFESDGDVVRSEEHTSELQ